ncbi:MAG: CapA family protein, partial [Spirochaetia bacterium]|nr:CapA family protein [Spirochaetia bacterium]
DLIIGHHPHVIQGIEEFEHGLIVYSLGNFCFPSVTSPHIRGIGFSQKRENRESYIFQCEITPVGLGPYSVVPVSLNHDLQPVIASGATESKIHAQIQYLSEPLNQLNYKKLYFEKQNKKVNQKSRLSSLWKKEGFLGVIKRLRIIYIMAYLIAFVNSLREAKHRRHFFSLLSNKIKD